MNVGTAGVELLLGITGLCGLMPLDTAEPPRLGIVCVDAEDANGVQSHDRDHFTGLLVKSCTVLAEDGWEAGEKDCEKLENDREKCKECGWTFYSVDRMRIWLENAPDAPVDVYRCGVDPTAVCPNEGQVLCFDWVPPMKRLSPGRPVGPLLEVVADRRVTGVLDLSGGWLTAGSLGATKAGPPPVWRIDAGGTFGNDLERVMAESMVYYRNLGDVDEVEICLCSLDESDLGSSCSTECNRSLTLGPAESGDIELFLTNQPEEHRFPGTDRLYEPPLRNRHFPHLYRLLDGPVHTPVPRVQRACRCEDEGKGEPLEELLPEVEKSILTFLQRSRTAGNVMCPGADYGGG